MRASYNKRCSEETAEKKHKKGLQKGERIISGAIQVTVSTFHRM